MPISHTHIHFHSYTTHTHTHHRRLWEETNNTVGFNHMVASGPDAAAYAQGQAGPVALAMAGPVALAMETMYEYIADGAGVLGPRDVYQ